MNEIDFFQNTTMTGEGDLLRPTFDWVFWLFMLFNVFAIAYIRTLHPRYFGVLFRTGIYNRQLYQNIQDDLKLNGAGSVLLTISYFNCIAIITSSLIFPDSPVWVPLAFLVGIVVIFLLKYSLIKSIGYLSQTREGTSEHWINHLIFFQISGILITPVLCFTHFLSQSVQYRVMLMLAILVGIMIFIREIQSFIRAIRVRVSLLYIILYLCTLEIIPLVVIIKALVK